MMSTVTRDIVDVSANLSTVIYACFKEASRYSFKAVKSFESFRIARKIENV